MQAIACLHCLSTNPRPKPETDIDDRCMHGVHQRARMRDPHHPRDKGRIKCYARQADHHDGKDRSQFQLGEKRENQHGRQHQHKTDGDSRNRVTVGKATGDIVADDIGAAIDGKQNGTCIAEKPASSTVIGDR